MAIAATTGTSANDSTGALTSKALGAIVATATRQIYVGVALASISSSVSSITDTAGNTYTLVTSGNSGGVRTELWKAKNITGNASNVITVNFSPATSIAIAAEEYSGADNTPSQNNGASTGSSTFPDGNATTQKGNNFVVGVIGFVCQSGDTLAAVLGNSRQSSIPAATAVGVALYDNTAVGNSGVRNMTKIANSRDWAVASVEVHVTGGVSVPYQDYEGRLPIESDPLTKINQLNLTEPKWLSPTPTVPAGALPPPGFTGGLRG